MIQIHTSGPAAPCVTYREADSLLEAHALAERAGFRLDITARAVICGPDWYRLPLIPLAAAVASEASEEDLKRIAAAIETTFAIQSAAAPWSKDFGPIEREQLGRLARDVAANAAMVIGEMLHSEDPSIAIGRGRR